MKYLKLFSTESDRNTYLSGNFDKPNVSVVKGSTVISYTPKTNTLEFPVYLVEGDNGEIGIALYNYLIEKYDPARNNILDSNDVIYITSDYASGGMTTAYSVRIRTNGSTIVVGLYYGTTMGDMLLYSNGFAEQEYTEPLSL